MTDSNTARGESRHVSIWIDTSPAVAYAYVSDPSNLPEWAAGLSNGAVRQVDGTWVVSSPMGEATVEFAPENSFGVADHSVRTDGQRFYNPMRIVPDGESENRCEVIFTVRRMAGVSDADVDADAAAVAADLRKLREILRVQ
jgi:hypothetical protein